MEYSSGWNYSSIVVKLEHLDSGLAIVCIGIANPVRAVAKSAMPARYRAGADDRNRPRTIGPIPLPKI
jgi:hypothetical protein